MTIENDIRLHIEDIAKETDWANINHYKKANAELGAPLDSEKRVVFIGDSITENWGLLKPEFFSKNKFINRGISGQTSPQMLIRFRSDAIELEPSLIIILAGTNDIAGNTGPTTINMISDNIISMSELAISNNINVIISSVLPVHNYNWSDVKEPNKKITDLNKILCDYTVENNLFYLDYYSSMVDNRPGLKKDFSEDEVHPNKAAYEAMSDLALNAIKAINV
jgi:lysophospholipase L1-like esterase